MITPLLLITCFLGARQDVKPNHLTQAEQLVANLQGVADNHYGGGKRHIDWNPQAPSARCVCSSFATLLLMHSYDLTEADIKLMGCGTNPKAGDYYDATIHHKGFARLHDLRDLKPGDYIFLKYTDGHISGNGEEDTGHVMLLDSVPQPTQIKDQDKPNATVYTVDVIDSSASGHGAKDTRHIGKNQFTGGVGRGTIHLVAETASGAIVGYSWSTSAKSPFYHGPARKIVAARVETDFFRK